MDEHELGRLLGMLQPAPAEWTRVAQELPFLGAELDGILTRARGDDGFRRALRADAGSALREQGYDLSPSVVAHIMRRLPTDDARHDAHRTPRADDTIGRGEPPRPRLEADRGAPGEL